MPSFDIVSEVDSHELTNAVDIANRELKNRFDFWNVDASFTLDGFVVTLQAPSDFQVQQMLYWEKWRRGSSKAILCSGHVRKG